LGEGHSSKPPQAILEFEQLKGALLIFSQFSCDMW
jgi:hypothetical protein